MLQAIYINVKGANGQRDRLDITAKPGDNPDLFTHLLDMGAWLKQLSQRTERIPFEELAARYSFVVPFAAIFVSFVLITTSNLVFHTPGGIADVHSIAGCLLCVMLSSGIMGIVALFGISRYGRKRILCRAAVGVITSVIVGFLAWLFLALEHFKQ